MLGWRLAVRASNGGCSGDRGPSALPWSGWWAVPEWSEAVLCEPVPSQALPSQALPSEGWVAPAHLAGACHD